MKATPPSDDVHAPYVQQLTAAGDWAALARYWMAHLYDPALDTAIDLVNQFATRDGPTWTVLAKYLDRVRTNPIELRVPSGQSH